MTITTKKANTKTNLENISKPALERILRRAGVKRISSLIYEKLRNVMNEYMSSLLRDMIIFTEYGSRKTILIEDLNAALEVRGIYLAAGLNPNTKKVKNIQSCNSKGKSGPVKKNKAREEGYPDGKPDGIHKKIHRFRPGTRALRAIRYQQKNSDCLAIPMANFNKLARELCLIHSLTSLRFSSGVLSFLQLVIEDFLINLCIDSYKCSIFNGRDTIYPKDVDLVLSIRQI